MSINEKLFKTKIVQLILMKEPFEAIEALSRHYTIEVPRLKVGCYVAKTQILNLFYHKYSYHVSYNYKDQTTW